MSKKTAVLAIMLLSIALSPDMWSTGRQTSGAAPGETAPVLAAVSEPEADARANDKDKPAVSAKAFLKASEVFLNPRCANCHPKGDRPLQGNDSHPHIMHVVRGPEGLGANGLWCSSCHQDRNLPGAHMPPGSPGWGLPPADMPMVFEGSTPHDICLHLKDPAQNGLRSPEEVLEHVETAPIVLWGWDPGEGRTPVPMSHEEFVKNIRDWVDNGTACPE